MRRFATKATSPLNKCSAAMTQDIGQSSAKSMLFGAGLKREDMSKAQVGISSIWWEGNPCNTHLRRFSDIVSESVNNGTSDSCIALRYNSIGVSDGMTMGTHGMRYSLPTRDLIADSIEAISTAQHHDAIITIAGCDKNMPGSVMGLARCNKPGFMIYGGSIGLGCDIKGNDITLMSVFEKLGKYRKEPTDENKKDLDFAVEHSCPGSGGCGGMYTANTMSTSIEAMGMSPLFSSSNPAESQEKINELQKSGERILKLLELDLKPRDIMTREAFENATTVVMALGGSTNACLHIPAMAYAADVDWTLDDIQAVSDKTPYIGNLTPSGKYSMIDVHKLGGTPLILKYLLDEGYLHGSCMTCSGRTLAEELVDIPDLEFENQDVVRPVSDPIKETGHLRILYGNVAPTGAVAKITGQEGIKFEGVARVFDSEAAFNEAFKNREINGETKQVIVIRHEGPQGGPGMPEMLKPTSSIYGAGFSHNVALITDGRFSGASHGFIVGHITPEAVSGGPIGLLQDGDVIEIDAVNNTINAKVSESEFAARKAKYQPPPPRYNKGILKRYAKCVSDASHGCVLDM